MNIDDVLDETTLRGYDDPVFRQTLSEVLHVLLARDSLSVRDRSVILEQAKDVLVRGTILKGKLTEDNQWKPFSLGYGPPGTILRVKKDAYTSEVNSGYNGLACTLVSGKSGRALVKFLGREPSVMMYVFPSDLEVLTERDKL